MSSATRTRATTSATALALMLAFLGAQLAGSVHQLRHVHVVCLEHGNTVDVDLEHRGSHHAHGVESSDSPFPRLAHASHAGAHEHTHCPFVAFLRCSAQPAASNDPVPEPETWQAPPRPDSVPLLPAIALLRLAPKASPPTLVG